MTKKTIQIRIWRTTWNNLKNKKFKIESDLREMGKKGHVPITRLIHAMSLAPFIPEEAGIRLRQLTSKKYKI